MYQFVSPNCSGFITGACPNNPAWWACATALIGVMLYSFARVSAAVSMRLADYYTQGKRSFFRLHEKGGKYLVVPAHHVGQAYVGEYNEIRPHGTLNYLTPAAIADRYRKERKEAA